MTSARSGVIPASGNPDCGNLHTQRFLDSTVYALEAAIRREEKRISQADRLALISGELLAKAGPNGRDPTRDEIDAAWGH